MAQSLRRYTNLNLPALIYLLTRPQLRNEPQNLLEHLPWDGDLGHPVAHDLRADLDQLFLQTRQRPVLDRLRRTFGTTVAST